MKKKKKKKKKIVPTSQKISCLLARISCFSENCLFLIPITFSTSSKIALTKKTLFPLGRNSFSNSWIKDFEKSVTTIWKSCFYFKKSLKKMVFNGSSSKIDFYLISIKVSTSRKNLRIKQYRFQQTKNLIPLARVKYWLKNMLQLAAISEKGRKNDFHQPENSFPLAQISLPQHEYFLKNWILPNFSNGTFR